MSVCVFFFFFLVFFFQAEDGIRDLVRSRGLGDVYKRQALFKGMWWWWGPPVLTLATIFTGLFLMSMSLDKYCLLYTSDAADERSSVDLGGRRIIKKKTKLDIPEDRRQLVKHTTKKTKQINHKKK